MASCQRLREGSDGAGNGGYGVLLRVRMRHSMGRGRAGGGRHTCFPHTDALGASKGPAQQPPTASASGAGLRRRARHASMRACGARSAHALRSAVHAYSSLPQTHIQLAGARGEGRRAHLAAPRRAPRGPADVISCQGEGPNPAPTPTPTTTRCCCYSKNPYPKISGRMGGGNIGVTACLDKFGACRFVNVGQKKCTEPTPPFTVKY